MSFPSTFARLDAVSHFTVKEVYSRRNLLVLQDGAGQHHLAQMSGAVLKVGSVVEGAKPKPGVSVMSCPDEHRSVTMTFLHVRCQLESAREQGRWREQDAALQPAWPSALHGPNG